MVAGGVAFLKGTSSKGSNTFIDSVFTNNTAEATNDTMMAAGGALYLDAAINQTVGTLGTTATIQTTKDLSYTGNRVIASDSGNGMSYIVASASPAAALHTLTARLVWFSTCSPAR